LETKKSCVLAVLLLVLPGFGCKGKHNRVEVQNEEPADTGPRMLSTVRMSDTKATAQLLSGFYAIENNSWRWTGRNFSALLRTPLAAAQRGATLNFAFSVPDVVTQKLGDIKLTASVNGMPLKSADYKSAGAYVFTADVPASLLASEAVKIDFSLNKSLPPEVDKRELGIVASSVGLASK
jgi:hypothetical protein